MTTSARELPIVSIRSTKGCWTCRLRKKKCDEVRPGCLRCASVKVDCHYGAKPKWIEDPALGREELARVKALVGVTASRKRAEHRARARTAPPPPPAPSRTERLPGGSVPEEDSTRPQNLLILEDQITDESRNDESRNDEAAMVLGNSEPTWLTTWLKDDEANLIMHYLDHVFYIQFRFYRPSVSAGGRGWFLSLLTRTKPLYHVALSLSAFHQQSLVLLEQGSEGTSYLNELELQYNLTLKELQVFISDQSSTNSVHAAFDRNVQILACVVQLISFELFKGGLTNWQMHLRAASDLVLILHESDPLLVQSPVYEHQPLKVQSPEKSALKFFTGCVLWYDVLSCVSTGLQSHLAQHHSRLLGTSPELGYNIELHTICGARNWVMVLIGEIANLAARKADSSSAVDHAQGFDETATEIEFRLLSRHREVREELDSLRKQYGGAPPHSLPEVDNQHTVLFITNIFASAAIVYLHTATASPDMSPSLIQLAVRNSIDSMQMVPDPRMFRGLIWPLCIAGCMASSEADQEFFRAAATGAVRDARRFGNSAQALEILERSWLLQSQWGRLVDCAATIRDLGSCVLLC